LLAAAHSEPPDTFASAAVVEVDATTSVGPLCEAATDRIGMILETAMSLNVLGGGTNDLIDLVAKSPLK
jgi:hypothetical protein